MIRKTLNFIICLIFKISVYFQNTHFELYHLIYDCQYQVDVSAVNLDGQQGALVSTNFTTPPCEDIVVKGSVDIDCPIGGEYAKFLFHFVEKDPVDFCKYWSF